MEPNIEMDSNSPIIYTQYINILACKIKTVFKKVGFSYYGIKWIVFDPKISDICGNKPNNIEKLFVGSKGKDYGACNLEDTTIWISTLAIAKAKVKNNILPGIEERAKEDFLADVILDEIAHISTKSNHGQEKYDNELVRLKDIYYGNLINRMLYCKRKK